MVYIIRSADSFFEIQIIHTKELNKDTQEDEKQLIQDLKILLTNHNLILYRKKKGRCGIGK